VTPVDTPFFPRRQQRDAEAYNTCLTKDGGGPQRNEEDLLLFRLKTNWKSWAKAALIRAVRTFAEAALAYIGTGAVVLGDVNWIAALSAGGFGFVTAILLALTGLPEADQK